MLFRSAVATLGTATTPMHVQKLLRQTDEIVYCFDGDNAGRRAAWRALENSLAQTADGKQIKFLFLPQGEDPDSYVRQHGKEAFESLLGSAMPLSRFLISELSSRVDRGSPEGRARLLQDAKPLVAQIAAPLLARMLRKELADIAGFTPQELDREFDVKASTAMGTTDPTRERASAKRAPPQQRSLVRTLCELLMVDPALAASVDRVQLNCDVPLPGVAPNELRALLQLLDVLAEHRSSLNIAEFFRGTPFEDFFVQAEVEILRWQERGLDGAAIGAEFSGAWGKLLEMIRHARMKQLVQKSREKPWNAEEQSQFLLLQQQVTHTTPK